MQSWKKLKNKHVMQSIKIHVVLTSYIKELEMYESHSGKWLTLTTGVWE